jgi:hypothetical protein
LVSPWRSPQILTHKAIDIRSSRGFGEQQPHEIEKELCGMGLPRYGIGYSFEEDLVHGQKEEGSSVRSPALGHAGKVSEDTLQNSDEPTLLVVLLASLGFPNV